MGLILFQFGLMGLNLYLAKCVEDTGKNAGFQYFAAGICCMGGIIRLFELL